MGPELWLTCKKYCICIASLCHQIENEFFFFECYGVLYGVYLYGVFFVQKKKECYDRDKFNGILFQVLLVEPLHVYMHMYMYI